MKAILMLEDGTSFIGKSLGISGEKIGEVILNTGVVGYQEMMTDPANAGKILILTYPLIGNYGIAPKFNESKQIWLAGLAIKEQSRIYSNWQAEFSFDDFLKEHNLLTISQVDTRTIAVHLRQKGQVSGIISTASFESKELLAKIAIFRKKTPESLLPKISVAKPTQIDKEEVKSIAILDLGVTNSIIGQLQNLGFSITLLPYNTPAQQILELKPQGLIISSGPEEDVGLKEVVANVRDLIGRLPILGISTGHQVLSSALGAKVNKMKFGHHGVNYPIYNPGSYKGEITVQNHSWVVDVDSLSTIKEVAVTAFNLNDNTVEEIESKKLKFIGVQYFPASPGLNEINAIFTRFTEILKT